MVDPGLDTHAGVGRQVAWSGGLIEALTKLGALSSAAADSEQVELMATIEINGRAPAVGFRAGLICDDAEPNHDHS